MKIDIARCVIESCLMGLQYVLFVQQVWENSSAKGQTAPFSDHLCCDWFNYIGFLGGRICGGVAKNGM